MSLKHFAFKRKPFTPLPDHRELFQTRGHQELRARLQLAIEDRDPSLVVGESGVGKTTSLRSVLATLDKRAYPLIELDEPRLKLRSLYGTLATGLGLAPTFLLYAAECLSRRGGIDAEECAVKHANAGFDDLKSAYDLCSPGMSVGTGKKPLTSWLSCRELEEWLIIDPSHRIFSEEAERRRETAQRERAAEREKARAEVEAEAKRKRESTRDLGPVGPPR